jgi:hydrogenase maturation protein HypF
MNQRRRITIHGIVQGVGFRPFVRRLALELGLGGWVKNFTGGVAVEVEGPAAALDAFVARLQRERPPIAVIESLRQEQLPPQGDKQFVIVASEPSAGPIFVSPDVAICSDCRRELLDPRDRRFGHPFINCTNCGPRFTIIRRLPYDRPQTSMARFPMCEACRAEYEDLTNRRYHAQPVCCPDCGPTLWLADRDGAVLARGPQALAAARALLASGKIVAVKGLGGFHLACDATNQLAVEELRRRKRRWQKPLAVMAPSLEAAASFAELDEHDRRLLSGPQAPILLLPKRLPERLARAVAPDSCDYGVMLPYTPLHILLLGAAGPEGAPAKSGSAGPPSPPPFLALVMTSGNLSEEPLCVDNEEARQRLGHLADAFLLHDRDILIGCDDSVLRSSALGPIMIRRSRGYAPLPVKLPLPAPPVLALGGHLKNTFCLAQGELAYPSQHIGDLDNAATLAYLERSLARMQELFELEPQAVACDLHPDYLSTRLAERLAAEQGLPLVRVQHHHAHLAACLVDNRLQGPALAAVCDGTGYGGDGTVWGCEVLVGDLRSFRRLAHLRYVPLPGGEQAIREPWRAAVAWLADSFGLNPDQWPPAAQELQKVVGAERVRAVLQMMRRGVNCPYASSAGRLFDAVAALLGLKVDAAYEAQAAMALEAAARQAGAQARRLATLPFAVEEEPGPAGASLLVIDPRPIFRALCTELERGAPPHELAARFHWTFAHLLAQALSWSATQTGLTKVALSGGTFQNRLLLEALVTLLQAQGFEPVWHRALSPNDSSLGVGQAAVAAAQLHAAPRARTAKRRARFPKSA